MHTAIESSNPLASLYQIDPGSMAIFSRKNRSRRRLAKTKKGPCHFVFAYLSCFFSFSKNVENPKKIAHPKGGVVAESWVLSFCFLGILFSRCRKAKQKLSMVAKPSQMCSVSGAECSEKPHPQGDPLWKKKILSTLKTRWSPQSHKNEECFLGTSALDALACIACDLLHVCVGCWNQKLEMH